MSKSWQMHFCLTHSQGKTIHTKLLNQITSDIILGRLNPGTLLPSSRKLAEQLSINRKTVQVVYEELEAQGWLLTKPRSGTFVAYELPEQSLTDSTQHLVTMTQKTKATSGLVEMLYQNAIEPLNDFTSLNDGSPDSRLIPYTLLARTYRKVCIELSRKAQLGYGDPRGTPELRGAIANMLSFDRFMNCNIEEVCIVRGSQMGIYLASKVLDPRKGAIVVEALCYLPAKAAFEAHGFVVLPCPIDDNGLDTEQLAALLATHPIAAVYVTPHHQYPTTVTMPMERRLALLALSKAYNFAILEDDYDHEFHYNTRPIPPLSSLPNSENVIHVGSMSKVFAPGLRLGYIAAAPEFIERIAQQIMLIDRQGNTVSEIVLASLMDLGEVKRHIRKTRRQYQARRDFAMAELERVFGTRISYHIPTGGLALWLDISTVAKTNPLSFAPSKDFTLSSVFTNSQSPTSHIRFGFGALSEPEICKAIHLLYDSLFE
ncbi:PLP-dependent aminotransferase family protein [Pseudoalteromonas maricaloris]|uniref:MocR-like pyridoxine biosynthesis transcription factor PdxR n=1 Tax=Pseudoalteromonas maricaloris TaxID=184924 RepID=UPI0021ADC01C|nr:PLP-dependent aminotransferase family protein [Pseudoalteromonas flavipulchra]